MFQINNGNTGTMCKIYSNLTIKTLEQRHVIVNFEHISPFSRISVANFEQVHISQVGHMHDLSKAIIKTNQQLPYIVLLCLYC